MTISGHFTHGLRMAFMNFKKSGFEKQGKIAKPIPN